MDAEELEDELDNDQDNKEDASELWFHSVRIVSGANMASSEAIKLAIADIEKIINTGYYGDSDGDELFKQIVNYLKKKL